MVVTVPVSNSQRIVCAAKRSIRGGLASTDPTRRAASSFTMLRAGLVRETFSPQIHRPMWNALIAAARVEVPDPHGVADVLSGLLPLMTDELKDATPEMVAMILSAQRDLLEGVQP